MTAAPEATLRYGRRVRRRRVESWTEERLVTRRNVLGAALATPVLLALAGCTTSDPADRKSSTNGSSGGSTAAPDPDAPARARAIASSALLVTAYEQALVLPDTAPALTPLLADHRAHLSALGADPAASATPTATTATGSAAVTTTATTTAAPLDPAATIAALIEAERAASSDRTADAVQASGGAFARLLASIAACQSVHITLLQAGPGADLGVGS